MTDEQLKGAGNEVRQLDNLQAERVGFDFIGKFTDALFKLDPFREAALGFVRRQMEEPSVPPNVRIQFPLGSNQYDVEIGAGNNLRLFKMEKRSPDQNEQISKSISILVYDSEKSKAPAVPAPHVVAFGEVNNTQTVSNLEEALQELTTPQQDS